MEGVSSVSAIAESEAGYALHRNTHLYLTKWVEKVNKFERVVWNQTYQAAIQKVIIIIIITIIIIIIIYFFFFFAHQHEACRLEN